MKWYRNEVRLARCRCRSLLPCFRQPFLQLPVIQRMGSPVVAALTATKITAGTLAVLASVSLTALAGNDNRAPEVPTEIFVDSSTNKVQLAAFGVGTQNYTWDGSTWTGPVPRRPFFMAKASLPPISRVRAGKATVEAWLSERPPAKLQWIPPLSHGCVSCP